MRTLKSLTLTIVMMVVTVGITSCGDGIPKGDDKDVITTVQSICIKNQAYKDRKLYRAAEEAVIDEATVSKYSRLAEMFDKWPFDEKKSKDKYAVVQERLTAMHKKYAGAKYANMTRDDYYKLPKEEQTPELWHYILTVVPSCTEYGKQFEKLNAEYNKVLDTPENYFPIRNIRTVKVDEASKMSVSQAEFYYSTTKKIDIIYSAQRNSDGEVYVEVQFN